MCLSITLQFVLSYLIVCANTSQLLGQAVNSAKLAPCVIKLVDMINFLPYVITLTIIDFVRVPTYGKAALESTRTVYGHGCGLLSVAQEVTDPLGDVPKGTRNEEAVKGTEKTSGSNVDDAPPPEKVDSE